MEFRFYNIVIHIQIIPLYGLSFGFLYYNPNLEPDKLNVDTEDFYEQLTVLIIFFGLHITYYRI